MFLRRCLLAVTVVALSSVPEFAQTGPTLDNPPVFKTHARDVVVDVVVTKGNNEPVTGLRAHDFAITEDGKPQAIDFFEEHSAKTLPAGAVQPLPKMPPGVYTNVPPAPDNDSVNVLLLDALNTDQEDQVNVRNQIIHFLKTMQPGTRTAIFTLPPAHGTGVHF